MKGRARHRRSSYRDEPSPKGDEWVDWGGELYFAVDFTEGGAPIGLGLDEWRDLNEESESGAGWARAKQALRRYLAGEPCGDPDSIGFIRHIGDGLSWAVFSAECVIGREAVVLLVKLSRRDAGADLAVRARREAALLARLLVGSFPLGLSRVRAVLPIEPGTAMISEPVAGIPLDTRASRTPGGKPWEHVACAAAAVHSIDPAAVGDVVEGPPTRREHARFRLGVLDRIDLPEAREARAWAEKHLPPPDASRLVHGDLLGQNLLLRPGEPLAVLDWEHASLGDPAYDLAIVTRGVRRPFQIERGLERLLESYAPRSPVPIAAEHVRLHEACLLAGFYEAALREDGESSGSAEQARSVFAGFVRRLVGEP